MKRRVRMLPLDTIFFRQFGLGEEMPKVVHPQTGVHLNNLLRIMEKLINEGQLPADARMEWLYFDTRFNNWAIIIASEQYPELSPHDMTPLLEF